MTVNSKEVEFVWISSKNLASGQTLCLRPTQPLYHLFVLISRTHTKFRGVLITQVKLLSLGATIHSLEFPGQDNQEDDRDVILGFDHVTGYDGTGNRFFWGTTGRLTNRFYKSTEPNKKKFAG